MIHHEKPSGTGNLLAPIECTLYDGGTAVLAFFTNLSRAPQHTPVALNDAAYLLDHPHAALKPIVGELAPQSALVDGE
jgi:hypothetical protein